VDGLASLTPQQIIDNRTALVGTPEEVVEQVQYTRDVLGEIEPSLQINFGGIGDREAFRTLELFASRALLRSRE
jgi:alkanesulfonate monooxygenase SsuD/methylene tetrahydromethanopterin reductase-like flavin-dependent oxidoreductase (luciferase family)